MPTYEYECPGEGIKLDLNLPYDHKPPRCETCGAELKRIYSATPVHFKAEGFYSTGG